MTAPDTTVAASGDPLVSYPLLEETQGDSQRTRSLLSFLYARPGWKWWTLTLLCAGGTALFFVAIAVTVAVGVGTWGNNIPVAWALAITNFVWWIGIGHAGTLISAILLLFGEKWRSSVNRFAETMTLFAVACAGLFPLLHLGRPWKFYYLVPYPSSTRAWPQFKSPLTWDIAAITTYLTVSVLFWYLGMLPDLATARDSAKSRRAQWLLGVLALGWRGSARHWTHWREGYLLIAGLATPLVVSVHSIVSFDFAVAQLPGWHTTVFPPYFVAGAVFSGMALVLTLLIPARSTLKLEQVVTKAHLDAMGKVVLATGLFVAYGYVQEQFFAWYSGDEFEAHVAAVRRSGAFAPIYWTVLFCNVLVPQVLWFSKARVQPIVLWTASVLINVGMWLERYMIVVSPLEQDFLPSAWHGYRPTWVDVSLLLGSLCFFGLGFLLTAKLLPLIPVSEVKALQRELAAEQSFQRELESVGVEAHP